MSGSKHDKGESPFTDDLERNPSIGQSGGSFATGEDPTTLEGDNTSEGDVENDADPRTGAVNEDQLGRTNA
ncbi:hypothetical protein OMW55_09370 [Sphingomonas sp. BN140010]|uniref:Uncharacterized protein n=1 Tax=Sphingomonas arvum TaxID=2992113 RepID=A0ABT3JGV6_9SPHN|nr:hypothetical protein [Sphingomonas sp. BN140010]MCW3798011.1 hypothetical protein [Sphingomonas sp. BN140010]